MKTSPVELILNNNSKTDKNFYFITGNEPTFMEKIKQIIVGGYSNKENTRIERIKNIDNCDNSIGLFESNKIYVVTSIDGVNNEKMDKLVSQNNIFIFFSENSPKTKTLKNLFIKRKDSCLFECYELSKEEKIKILNKWANEIGLNLESETYWSLVEKLDNRYVFLENELRKLEEFEEKDLNTKNINKIIFKNTKGLDKIFFYILYKNEHLVNIYNEKVTDKKDVNELYHSFKQLCMLIIYNNTELDFSKNIPNYLFRQKNYLIGIFNKYNSYKKKLLVSLLEETEKSLRKEDSLSLNIGLRFLFRFKKLTIS